MKEHINHIPAIEEGIPAGPYRELFQFGLKMGTKLGQIIDHGIDAVFDSIEQKKEDITW